MTSINWLSFALEPLDYSIWQNRFEYKVFNHIKPGLFLFKMNKLAIADHNSTSDFRMKRRIDLFKYSKHIVKPLLNEMNEHSFHI